MEGLAHDLTEVATLVGVASEHKRGGGGFIRQQDLIWVDVYNHRRLSNHKVRVATKGVRKLDLRFRHVATVGTRKHEFNGVQARCPGWAMRIEDAPYLRYSAAQREALVPLRKIRSASASCQQILPRQSRSLLLRLAQIRCLAKHFILRST